MSDHEKNELPTPVKLFLNNEFDLNTPSGGFIVWVRCEPNPSWMIVGNAKTREEAMEIAKASDTDRHQILVTSGVETRITRGGWPLFEGDVLGRMNAADFYARFGGDPPD